MVTITNKANAVKNTSDIGDQLLRVGGLKDEVTAAPIMFAKQYEAELIALAFKVKKSKSARETLLEFFHATTAQSGFATRYEKLKKLGDTKTKEQFEEQAAMLRQQNAATTLLGRACDVATGIKALREIAKCKVLIERVPNQKIFVCYVSHDMEGDRDHATFSSTQLQGAAEATFSADMTIQQIKKACNNVGRAGSANDDKGGITKVPTKEIDKVSAALDTTLAGLEKLGSHADQLGLLWARLDASLSLEEKNKARAAFNAEAAKEAVEDVRAKQAIQNAMKGKKSA